MTVQSQSKQGERCCLCTLPLDDFLEGIHTFEDGQKAHLRCWQNGPVLGYRRALAEAAKRGEGRA